MDGEVFPLRGRCGEAVQGRVWILPFALFKEGRGGREEAAHVVRLLIIGLFVAGTMGSLWKRFDFNPQMEPYFLRRSLTGASRTLDKEH